MAVIFTIACPLLFISLGLLFAIYPEKIWSFNKKLADGLGIDNKYFYNEGSELFGVNKNRENQIKFISFLGWLFAVGGLFFFVLSLSTQVILK